MILIIGIGNPLRQDDGAGWALAVRLGEAFQALGCSCRILTVQQLAPEHAVDVAALDVTAVVLADVAVDTPGLRLAALDAAPTTDEAARLTHEIGPRTLVAYAAILCDSLPPVWLLTVGGSAFEHGEGLSPTVLAALADNEALAALARRICTRDIGQSPPADPRPILE